MVEDNFPEDDDELVEERKRLSRELHEEDERVWQAYLYRFRIFDWRFFERTVEVVHVDQTEARNIIKASNRGFWVDGPYHLRWVDEAKADRFAALVDEESRRFRSYDNDGDNDSDDDDEDAFEDEELGLSTTQSRVGRLSIGFVIQRGSIIEAFDDENRRLCRVTFADDAELKGYTSSSFTVQRANQVWVYDPQGKVLSSRSYSGL